MSLSFPKMYTHHCLSDYSCHFFFAFSLFLLSFSFYPCLLWGFFFHNFVRSLPRDAYASNQTQTNSDVTNVVWTATSIGNKAEFAEKEGCRRVGGLNDCRSKFRADTSRDKNETLCHTKVVRTWPVLNGHTLIYRATKLAIRLKSPIGSKQMFMVIVLCHFGSVNTCQNGWKALSLTRNILNQSSFIIWNGYEISISIGNMNWKNNTAVGPSQFDLSFHQSTVNKNNWNGIHLLNHNHIV